MRDYSIDEVPRGLELENIFAALKELKAYEDSGLTPEQVQELQEKLKTKETINQLYEATTSVLGSDRDTLISKANKLNKQLAEYRVLGTAEELKGMLPRWVPVEERLPSEIEMKEAYVRNKYGCEFIVMIAGASRPTTLYRTLDGYWVDDNRIKLSFIVYPVSV